jgi:hypothetical protein
MASCHAETHSLKFVIPSAAFREREMRSGESAFLAARKTRRLWKILSIGKSSAISPKLLIKR